MEKGSIYSDYTTNRVPRSFHFVGIGRSGCQFIESILRTGFIEDNLIDDRSRVTTLAVDIGEQDVAFTKNFYNSFLGRLKDRGIPTERAHLRAVGLPVPKSDELSGALKNYPEFLKKEYPTYVKNPNFAPWIPPDQPLPKAGEHIPRAIAKAIYGKAYYQDKILEKELTDFADSVRASELPPLVFMVFGLAGGTGSGIAVDLARHLAYVKMPEIMIGGIGFLPCEGDPEEIRGANLYSTLNEIDLLMDFNKNSQLVKLWGDIYRNPFTAGFLMMPLQPAYERLKHYSTGAKAVPRVRGWHMEKVKVTTKFLNDVLVKLITEDDGREFLKIMAPIGVFGPWHEVGNRNERSFTLWSINKLFHPAVALPLGLPLDNFRKELSLMISDSIPTIPLKNGFRTPYMECHISSPRGWWTKKLDDQLTEKLLPFLGGNIDDLGLYHHENFDLLNCYLQVGIPGVSKRDITYFTEARDKYEKLSDDKQKLLMHSLMLEHGVLVSEPSSTVENRAGKSLWGESSNAGVAYDVIYGTAEEAPDLGVILEAGAAPLIPLAVPVR